MNQKYTTTLALRGVPFYEYEPSLQIWEDKYKRGDEKDIYATIDRMVNGFYPSNAVEKARAKRALEQGIFLPAGRMWAGAGTGNNVTLMNCYVNETIEDSMGGISHALQIAMFTQQQGGGIGQDFSTLRPRFAEVKGVGGGAYSSGPISFMGMWDAMCETIQSAGNRRGAMMATMSIDHPDVMDFITAKKIAGKLTNFNVSVLITDRFMEAVENDELWQWFSEHKPLNGQIPEVDTPPGTSKKLYLYGALPARQIWRTILEHTYEYSEPGIIFIDRVNGLNNLREVEKISATNPCGEQPLPPNGACDLGHVNLARLVVDPFTPTAQIDWGLLVEAVRVGVRWLDRAIDVTKYPLPAQQKEQHDKRRIGLGITGLANCLEMLGLRYGSKQAVHITKAIMSRIAKEAYLESQRLAKEFGPFPLYKKSKFWSKPFPKKLGIRPGPMRNGVLLSIAPVGTGSLLAGNVSSGLEPVFAHTINRKVRQPDGTFSTLTVEDYGVRVFRHKFPGTPLPDHLTTINELTVYDHLFMQAACQEWVDASVSKTINVPVDMDFEAFSDIYDTAYSLGCKGCTSYRPSEIRGSILEAATDEGISQHSQGNLVVPERPTMLQGYTYKINWPSIGQPFYLTINDREGAPFECFIQSKSSTYDDWTKALALMISAIFRRGGDISFVADELKQVTSTNDSAWVDGKHMGSMVAYVGHIIEQHLEGRSVKTGEIISLADLELDFNDIVPSHSTPVEEEMILGELCNQCNTRAVFFSEGCRSCKNCGWSNCG